MKSQLLAISDPYAQLGVSSLRASAKPGDALFNLLGNFFQMAIVIAGLYALWNFLLAGYGFISAGGDPKNISKAWEKIYQTIIGLLVTAGSVTIAALIGYLIFKDPTFLITPRLITP